MTDRCNLRCQYCMPEQRYDWVPQPEVLSFEELERCVDALIGLGLERVRLTGGEPLLRADLSELIERLSRRPVELAMTTNGVRLAEQAAALWRAGLRRLTVSLDSLSRPTFVQLARRDHLADVLAGIDAARRLGFALKLDTVLLRGVNDTELDALLAFAREVGAELRFIEYMDVGGATRWDPAKVVSRAELLEHLGQPTPLPGRGSAPAERFELANGQRFGIVASTTRPFCGACDRVRLSADGQLFTCLYSTRGHDLKAALRGGASPTQLAELVQTAWLVRDDRGAELRAGLDRRGPLFDAAAMKERPHLEMHRRGG